MDRLRPAMLIVALVVDVGRRLPRRGAFAKLASTGSTSTGTGSTSTGSTSKY